MEQILHPIFGSQFFSLLDRFFGYNQVLVVEPSQLKTAFRTKWGTFTYHRLPFGSIKIGTNFQREMEITFNGLIVQSVVIYLDEITMYSKK